MSAFGVLADGFATAGDAAGLVAFGLVTGAVMAGALRRTLLAEVCAIWGLGFIAAYAAFASLGGQLELGATGLLAAGAAAVVGLALQQGLRGPWVEGAAVALWALCALRANAAADGDTLLRVVVWCSSAAVLATLALRLEEALAPRWDDAPRAALAGLGLAPTAATATASQGPGGAAVEPGSAPAEQPASAPGAAAPRAAAPHAPAPADPRASAPRAPAPAEPPASAPHAPAPAGPPASATRAPEPVLLAPATHLWSSDGYREATSRTPR